MMTWWTGSAIGLDTETDGKDPSDAHIITAAVVQISPGLAPVEVEVMAKPERAIDPEAIAVHGITTERAEAEGLVREHAIAAVVDMLSLAGEDRPVVCHNAAYDLTVLDREMRRTGVGWLVIESEGRRVGQVSMVVGDRYSGTTFPVLDSMVIDKAVDRYRPGKRQLSFVAAHYGVPMAEGAAHGATADVIAALRILIVIAGRAGWDLDDLIDRYRDRRKPAEVAAAFHRLGRLTLPELHTAQIGWAAEQADGLRQHFIEHPEKGFDPAGVDGSWPLRKLDESAAIVADVLTERETA